GEVEGGAVDRGVALRGPPRKMRRGEKADRDHQPVGVQREGLRIEGGIAVDDERADRGEKDEGRGEARPIALLLLPVGDEGGDEGRAHHGRRVGEDQDDAGGQDPGKEVGVHQSFLARSDASPESGPDSPSAPGSLAIGGVAERSAHASKASSRTMGMSSSGSAGARSPHWTMVSSARSSASAARARSRARRRRRQLDRSPSRTTPAMPTEMKTSATLKVGHW